MDSTIWDKAAATRQTAEADGVLESLATELTICHEGDLTFHLRQLSNLKTKHTQQASVEGKDHFNPFLPHEEAMYVNCVGPKHKLLLNKFNVLDDHLLLVTNQFEPQQSILNSDDFSALTRCMFPEPCLAFYNSGKRAGASQSHKHLQLIKLPAESHRLIAFQKELSTLHDEVPRELTSLPFKHAALALPREIFHSRTLAIEEGARLLQHLYDRLRMTLGIEASSGIIESPYNLLLTWEWMMMVPRTDESSAGISLNSLAFIGSILVKNSEQARQLKAAGLTQTLRQVSSQSA